MITGTLLLMLLSFLATAAGVIIVFIACICIFIVTSRTKKLEVLENRANCIIAQLNTVIRQTSDPELGRTVRNKEE